MDATSAALAGLLQDIGRFWQRAESGSGRALPPGYDGLEANGTHTAWSAAFIETYLPAEFRKDVSGVNYDQSAGTSPSAALVALADRLAAGDRADPGAEQPQQTSSILAELKAHPTKAYWPLRPLDLVEDTLFPLEQPLGREHAQSASQTLWAEFSGESARLRDFTDADSLLVELLGLLDRYAWCVPADSYRGRPDISLYDHSRVAAALAACLAVIPGDEMEAALDQDARRNPGNRPLALLLRGDISGVQKFIYTITARGATPSLRGRSFFLQLLTEAIARWILRQLELPITNLIYAGGGHFDLLVAAGHEARIADIQLQLDAILLEQFDGDLYVALGSAPLSQASLQREQFHKQWQDAGRSVSKQKRQRFVNDAARLFQVRGVGGGSEVECQVCHFEGADVKAFRAPNGDLVQKCALCSSLEELGKDLRGAVQLVIAEVPELESGTDERSWSAVLRRFGMAVSIQREAGDWSAVIEDALRGTLIGLQGYPSPADALKASRGIHSEVLLGRRQRFSVNVAPRLPGGDRATFEDLQDASAGLKRLGVLRMDVDNLGSLFAEGIQHTDSHGRPVIAATLARVASLSTALSRFFEGWVGVLAEQENEAAAAQGRTEPIYTIYSGGDDLFIVGAWDAVVRLAIRIRDDFARYASGNPSVHLSAGISLHGGKEPLYQAAQTAGDALEDAKALDGKNAISFLGESLKWDEFIALAKERDRLLELLSQRVDRSVLRVLMELEVQRAESARQLKARPTTKAGQPQIPWGPYMWRGAYLLRRFADRTEDPAKKEFNQFIDSLQKDNFGQIRNAAMAARWVEALTRKESKS